MLGLGGNLRGGSPHLKVKIKPGATKQCPRALFRKAGLLSRHHYGGWRRGCVSMLVRGPGGTGSKGQSGKSCQSSNYLGKFHG